MSDLITQQLRIFGRVQGVYYRGWCVETAQRLRLTGWVRNRKDGSVEAVVTGSSSSVESFVSECYKGPPAAKVETIQMAIGIDEGLENFEQRETL